ncbi:hypothetical protein QN277_010624 [Acacia crassicarpa]|uniref:Disease resistance protein At4g27190-like leucine-rich repeats domain-containing protein n=1 Tax=Acacia crassicarpa TaxID=499986 RepID=A0AAE1MB91_9FABA|nr:hypothetical protein QN277_010624 [Acacia crassicarpa]
MEMELQESSFTQLKTIEALQCDNKLNNFLSILLSRSYKLERLKIYRCELLQHVLDLTEFIAEEQRNIKFPNLNTMELLCLRNLNCIWNKDPRGVVELRKLVKLEIIECGLHKSPLSTALVEELVLLEALKIESCEMMEQVVEDDTEMQESSFRNLKDFQLACLPNLIKLHSGLCNVKFPELLSLRIENCPKFLSNQTLTIEGTPDFVPQNEMMHPCPKLQTLKLPGLAMLEDIWQGQDYRIPLCDLKDVEVDSFSKLRYMWIAKSENLERLVVRNCNFLGRLVLPSNCFNMTEIKISDCKILEEICIDPEQQKMNEKTIPNLGYIVLENLPKLSFFSLETCEFPSLRKLRIVNCPTLVTLPKNVSAKVDNSLNKQLELVLFEDIKEDSPPGVGKMKIPPQLESLELMGVPNLQLWTREPKVLEFEKLTSLKIINCGSFKKLFSISGAKQLSSLKLLALYGCIDMVHVLQGEGETGLQVMFKKLEKLVLKHLPKLTSFCEEDVDFGELPELKMVIVEDIPNMNTFVKQHVRTPKLKQVHVTYITKCWLGDLNQTIRDLHRSHNELKNEVWESDQSITRHHSDTAESSSDQSSTRHHSDTAESSSLQEINREKGKAPMK